MIERLKMHLDVMCKRCINHEVCNGTGCSPREELYKAIDDYDHFFHRYEHYKHEWCAESERAEELEAALDEACKHLSDENEIPCYSDDFDESKPLSQCNKCNNEFVDVEKCWKEYFLKKEETPEKILYTDPELDF